jgi:hypothetical protein
MFYTIYPPAEVSQWNRLMLSTLEFLVNEEKKPTGVLDKFKNKIRLYDLN